LLNCYLIKFHYNKIEPDELFLSIVRSVIRWQLTNICLNKMGEPAMRNPSDKTVLRKKGPTSITTKEGFKQANQELIENIRASLEGYEQYIKLGLLERSAVAKDIEELQKVQNVLEGRFSKRIDSLPDSCPPQPNYDDPDKDTIIEKMMNYKQMNQLLREYGRLYNVDSRKLTSIQQQFPESTTPEGAAKAQYEHLAISLAPDLKKYTPSENYKEDVELQRSMEKLEAMQNRFIEKNRQIAKVVSRVDKASPEEKLKIYTGVIDTLQFFKESFKQIREEIDARVEKLHSIEINYEKAVARNNSLVETSKELLQSPRLKQVQNYPESKESSFVAVLQDLQKLVKLPLADVKKPTSFNEMVEKTEVYNAQATNVAFAFTTLNEKIVDIESLVNKQIEKAESDIKKQEESFQHHVTDINNQIREARLPESTKITSIEKEFVEALKQSNEKNVDPLAFRQAKLISLQKIAIKLEEQVLVEQGLIREEYEKRINAIDTDIKKKGSTTLEKIQKGAFNFGIADQEAEREVKGHLTSLGGNVEGTIDGLKEVLEKASVRKMEFDKSLDVLERIIDTHETAKVLVDRITEGTITVSELVQAINESTHGSKLLKAMAQYPNREFNEAILVAVLNENLNKFDRKGVESIKAFVEQSSVRSKDKIDLEKKLAFMEVLEAKGIKANPFLAEENANAINAVLYLKSQNQTDFISEANLVMEASAMRLLC
jgi:hypothetical protein